MVFDLSSVRILLYEAGTADDILSSIDVSVAFLQAQEYGVEDKPKYDLEESRDRNTTYSKRL